ncbi:hypothetical protein AB0F25_26425 [Streptomyces wedmorensis]|uniref:hypothetical protein n=1 Tax=Streptomyces wedmorensis TaxID=43759 RepID=UPI00342073A2
MQKFATTAEIVAVLDIAAGDIRLVAGERDEVAVEVLPADASKGRDVKAAEGVEVAYEDGVLRVGNPAPKNRLFGESGVVGVTVWLPAGSRVEARTAAGELTGVGRLGEVAFEGAQSEVRLEEVAGGRIVLQAGGITVDRLGGDAEFRTQRGDIRVVEATRGAVTLRTEAGTIDVGAARGTSATLDAGTAYGRITNTLGNTEGADAGLRIHAGTSYGDITARSL